MESPQAGTWRGSDVDATTIERQMASLWHQVREESAFSGAIRTSILNLVVYTTSREEAMQVSHELRACSQRQPSRTIILVADRLKPGSSLDAEVSVRCGGGSSRPLCYEEIMITGRGRVADHLASVVIPLLMPQLPTYLWWPGQPPFSHRMFNRMLAIADQLVIDSAQFTSPGDGLANMARLCQAKQGVNDFNWGRLTPWREVIAQFFDGQAWLPYIHGVRSVRLEFGSGSHDHRRGTASVLLMLGWVGSQLAWEPETTLDGLISENTTLTVLQGDRIIDIDLEFADHGSDLAGQVSGVEIVSQPHGLQPARFTVQRPEDLEHAEVTVKVLDGALIRRVVPLQVKTDAELLTDELELAGHDVLYERVIDMASRMAGRELWTPV